MCHQLQYHLPDGVVREVSQARYKIHFQSLFKRGAKKAALPAVLEYKYSFEIWCWKAAEHWFTFC